MDYTLETNADLFQSTHTPKKRVPYLGKASDMVLAVSMLALGFFFWEWGVFDYFSGLGRTLFFLCAIIICFVYMQVNGIKQNAKSLTALAVCVAGSLPFVIYGGYPLQTALVLFDCAFCLIWVAYSCRTTIAGRLSGFIVADFFNQILIVPFYNFLGVFLNYKGLGKKDNKGRHLLWGIIGIAAAIPVIVLVISLLMQADANFDHAMTVIKKALHLENFDIYILEFFLGLPVACYIFGAVYGNSRKRGSDKITESSSGSALASAHKLPAAAVYTPVAILNLIYLIFIGVMASYLFSALAGKLPNALTYAQYARHGFFELCGIAAINMCVLIFSYCFIKRNEKEYPRPLRILSSVLTALTILLGVVAMSKLLLYIGAYGLSRLRIYSLWFIILILFVCVILIIWHIRPFNAGKPIVIVTVLLFLTLFYANTDGLIARYNVTQYEKGQLKKVDVEMMADMSDAVVPWLDHIIKTGESFDINLRLQAQSALDSHNKVTRSRNEDTTFSTWNITSASQGIENPKRR